MQNQLLMQTKKTIVALAIAMGLTACGSWQQTARTDASATSHQDYLLVGTYTDAKSEGIYTFNLDMNKHTVAHVATFKTENPSYMCLDEKHGLLFAVNENKDQPSVTAAKIDATTGELRLVNKTPTLGTEPAYITYHKGNVLTANYGGGSITLIEVAKNGAVGSPDWRIELGTQGIAHPHAIVPLPGSDLLYVPDLGQDKIFTFKYRNGVPPLTIADQTCLLPKGSGPRHLVFDKKGKYAYLVCELTPKVYVYKVGDNGWLMPLQEVNTGGQGGKGGGHIALSPDGKYLYTSHRLQGDAIITYKVGKNGMLTKVGTTPTSKHPRQFTFSPNGNYMAVACKEGDKIDFFQRNTSTGQLTRIPMSITISHPAFVLWRKASK